MRQPARETRPAPPRRFRDHGFSPGTLKPGRLNLISDVPGVRVGHQTLIEGDSIRTGVTVIDPGTPRLFHDKLPAAVAVGNGFGKLTGVTQINELGTLETPIALTNTLAVGPVMQGLVELVLTLTPDIPPTMTVNAVVGETNDGIVNDIHRIVVTPGDVAAAHRARTRAFALGSVGAGTGTSAFGWKGGIGSASRRVRARGCAFTVGALLQTNFGGALTIMGVPVGAMLGATDSDKLRARTGAKRGAHRAPRGDGSCMMILATDAPLSARQLGRIARRAVIGLGRTGSVLAHGSGDYAIAFSTSRAGVEGAGRGDCLPDTELNPFFLAAVEAVEESVYDSLFTAETVTGRNGNTLRQLPIDKVVHLMKQGRLTN
jgi:D-aminopeptidase